MRFIKWLLIAGVACATGSCLFGCGVEGLHSANPTTIVRVDPSSRSVFIQNNKDVDISFDEMTFKSGEFIAKNVKIVDKASSVRAVNVDQIVALGVQARAIGDAWAAGIDAGGRLAGQLVPILGGIQPRPIWGTGQPGAVPQGWQYVGPPTTTQPAATPNVATTQPAGSG